MVNGDDRSERADVAARGDCEQDPIGNLKEMFVDIVQARRIRLGQRPAQRPVFLKPHGVAHGFFEMRPDLPPDLQIGVFGLGRLRTWVRFSSDTLPTMPDLKTTCGVGIKLFGVPGAKLLGDGDTQDFILQNHDVFFVDTAREMCAFTRAGVVEGDYAAYLAAHPTTDRILAEMRKVESSVLAATYWSGLPYAFGAGRYVKYKLVPDTAPDGLPSDDPDYLAADLARRLPSIGIARVGNSPDAFFLGPEVADPAPEPPGFYRDASGALKRQAARFRIYGLNAEGQAVAELTLANAAIEWTVHLANKKAAWYQFQLALDIPEAASAPPSLLRNAAVPDRAALTIDPGARHIAGREAHGEPAHRFDTGTFMGTPVYLGELRTDSEGRLIVLGGHGVSASYNGARAITFANNDGWHDDVADGPVTARVTFDGQTFEADPAWIVVAPPNYAPQQKSVRTLWDLLRDVAIQAQWLPAPVRPSFTHDIRPIFERLSQLQWVNAGYAASFGWRGPNNLATRDWLLRLSRSDPDDRELRQTIANQFRVFDRDAWAAQPWPWLYGDAMNIPPAETPRQNVSLTQTQLTLLQQWAAGDFAADYDPAAEPPRSLDELPVAEQPDMLTRAALEFCLADAFHPGCEMTWPLRHASMYMAPFRIAHAPRGWVEPAYGPGLTQDVLSLPQGPLAAQVPGGLTRWMAVPWQTDTASCRSGYLKSYDPYLPTFWPARVPNQVLTREHYDIVLDASKPLGERLAAFANRAAWIRPLGSKSYTDQINNMIAHFGDLGIVEQRPGPAEGPFPPTMEVESLPSHTRRRLAAAGESPHAADRLDLTGIEQVRRFPHGLRR